MKKYQVRFETESLTEHMKQVYSQEAWDTLDEIHRKVAKKLGSCNDPKEAGFLMAILSDIESVNDHTIGLTLTDESDSEGGEV